MKTKPITVAASLGVGFSLWRLWERGRLSRRFVQADVSGQDAATATQQFMPFFSIVTYGQVENTIETAAQAMGQTPNEAYMEFAQDAYMVARGGAIT